MAENYDVLIIGAGVVGAAAARKLSAYDLKVALVEKECDVSFGVSKANSGIIHGGFHHDSSSLKSRLEIKGNLMFDQLKKELHFPFQRCGIVVAAFSSEEMRAVQKLYENGIANGVIGIELCSRERILSLEPKLNPDVSGGLFAPGGGIVEPYRFVFALVESAQKNGVDLFTNFEVVQAEGSSGSTGGSSGSTGGASGGFTVTSADGRTLTAGRVVNAAGLYADRVSAIFGAEDFKIIPRKGEEFLLDRNASAFPQRVVFPVADKISKGMLVIPTVEGTTMVGPTAESVEDKEDLSTSRENFSRVFYSARRLVPRVSERDIITSFTGLRPTMENGDFYIAPSQKVPGLIQAAGIQSPGLTASPAIAEYIKDLLKKSGLRLAEKPDYDPEVEPVPRFRNSTKEEIEQLIRKNPRYGEIICRCESVSEAEVVAAVRKGHTTLDGVKFYTRAMMGRCQGGFCTYRLLKIIARETGQSLQELTKRGGGSWILDRKVGDYPVMETAERAGEEKK